MKCFEDWKSYLRLAIPGFGMLLFEWANFEIGVIFSGLPFSFIYFLLEYLYKRMLRYPGHNRCINHGHFDSDHLHFVYGKRKQRNFIRNERGLICFFNLRFRLE